MFEIRSSVQQQTHLESRAVVDLDRGVTLVYVSGHGRVPGSAFVMNWGLRSNPFDAWRREVVDAVDGTTYYRTGLGLFGASLAAENAAGAKRFAFVNQEERSAAVRLAVEALLVYGSNYNGLSKPDGYNRVVEGGHEWRLSDFGIEGSQAVISQPTQSP